MDSLRDGVKRYYNDHYGHDNTPRLSKTFVAILSVSFTLAYVLPLYLSSTTRPSPKIWRDSPTVIQGRIRTVVFSTFCCSLVTVFVLSHDALKTRSEVFQLLGVYPMHYEDVLRSLSLTMLLFLGPLFENLIVEGGWRRYLTGRPLLETFDSWVGWRNYIAGPSTEEVMFRSLLTSLSLLTSYTPKQTVLITPLYFGIAHVHHFYEFYLTHPGVSLTGSFLNSVFQFSYTTLFGWYANFVFVRTGSLYSVILIHSFCNWMGLPRFWGRVEAGVPLEYSTTENTEHKRESAPNARYQYKPLSIIWTIAYYSLLVTGAIAFRAYFWTLTASSNELATF